MNKKTCTHCKIDKLLSEFTIEKNKPRSKCKSCKSLINKQWRELNKDKITIKNKEKWQKRKMDKNYLDRHRDYYHNKHLALNGKFKTKTTLNLIGCSWEDLKLYLESKFQIGMSWDNYGYYGWHIDHIIPVSNFDIENLEELKKCMHYTNLQPLWMSDNLKKGNRP